MTAQTHTEFVEAFYRISQDRANKIVILTGAGGDFITDVAWSSWGNPGDPGVWSQIHDEGVQVLENIANIRVPVIDDISGSHWPAPWTICRCGVRNSYRCY
jgi:enoyl-CoA hydratase/carnithine racemase